MNRYGLPGLFDVHVHFMPPAIMAAVWRYFDSAGPLLGREWPIFYRGSDDERLAQLRSFGVKRFTSLAYAHKPGVAEFMNDWTADFADANHDVLRSATFYPEPGVADYVAARIEAGVRVFKVHLQVGDFAADDPLLDPVWDVLGQSGTPIVIHAGSGPAPGRHTGPHGISRVLRRHPTVRFVVAHMGAPETTQFLDLADRYESLLLDTTMAFVDFWHQPVTPDLLSRMRDLQERILFGTDFPNIPYEYEHQVEALDRLGLGEAWMRDVLWFNGVRLFGDD